VSVPPRVIVTLSRPQFLDPGTHARSGHLAGDTEAVGVYRDRILPRLTDAVMDRGEFAAIRARVSAGLSGEVLELGFGSGLNVPHYPDGVSRVLAVEPAAAARKLAARRVTMSAVPVEYTGLDGQHLPVGAGSVDHVLVTWTLCTIPDAAQALREVYRVLRPGGSLHFAEHGRAPDPRVRRWQDRLTPLQRRLAGGCHLNRPIADLVAASGLTLTRLDNYYVRGPRPFGYTFEGAAVKN
jgi:SAM-dependent methyltransferase